MTRVALLFTLAIAASCGRSDELQLRDAERNLREGRFEEAAARYAEALPNVGSQSGAILNALGNCAAGSSRFAEAAWFYRRALRRRPGDASIEANLNQVESKLGVSSSHPDSFGSNLRLPGSATSWAIASAVLQLAGITGVLGRRRRAWFAAAIGVGLLLAAAVVRESVIERRIDAVVFSDAPGLRAEPHEDVPEGAKARAGEVLRVVEYSDRWVCVIRAAHRAWLPRAAVGIVES